MRVRRHLMYVVLLAWAGWLPSGCSNSTDAPSSTYSASTTKPEPAVVTPDMESVAKHLEQGLSTRRPHLLSNCFDVEVLVARATAGLEVSDRVRKNLIATMPSELDKLDQRLAEMVTVCTLLKVRAKDGEVRALYRLEPIGGGVNYLDFLLVRSSDGCVRVGDVLMYMLAGDYSELIRRPLVIGLEHSNRGLLDRLTGNESLLIKHADIIRAMNKALAANDKEGVLLLYRRLPDELQNHRMILELRMIAAQTVDEQEYAAAIDALAKHASGNPTINLLLIDAMVVRERPAEALACLEKLDAHLGHDPYLDGLRGMLLAQSNSHVAARAAIDRALAAFSDRREIHASALVVALLQKRFEHVMYELHVLETEFDINLDIEGDPRYAEFVASPQYTTWIIQHETPENISRATGFESNEVR